MNSSQNSKKKLKTAHKPKVLVIVGPTASGKSDLAVELARKLNGEVISADSRQVYKGLDIGSGKITKKEMKGVPHHLLSVALPKNVFTAERFKKLGKIAIKKILAKNKLPIIAGGTGLYIDSLIYDRDFPKVPPDIALRKRLGKLSTEELYVKLVKLDKTAGKRIDKHNRRRLIRAIEIVLSTGKQIPILDLQNRTSPYDIKKIGIKITPEKLKENIKRRLEKRLKIGMVREVKKLHRQGLSWKRLDDLGLEYRYISHYLRGLISYDEMKQKILRESYQYAKRQLTWFKRDSNIIWITNPAKNKKAVSKLTGGTNPL